MNGVVEWSEVMDSCICLAAYKLSLSLSLSIPPSLFLLRPQRRNLMTREHVKGKETFLTTRVSLSNTVLWMMLSALVLIRCMLRFLFLIMTMAQIFFFFFTLGKGGGRGHKISDYFEVGACSSFILLLVSIWSPFWVKFSLHMHFFLIKLQSHLFVCSLQGVVVLVPVQLVAFRQWHGPLHSTLSQTLLLPWVSFLLPNLSLPFVDITIKGLVHPNIRIVIYSP